MRPLMTFFLGMAAGGGLLYGAQNFHVIRAPDGVHFVQKINPKIAATYVDIRGFTIADWTQYKEIAAALIRAEKSELMQNAASDVVQKSLDHWLDTGEKHP